MRPFEIDLLALSQSTMDNNVIINVITIQLDTVPTKGLRVAVWLFQVEYFPVASTFSDAADFGIAACSKFTCSPVGTFLESGAARKRHSNMLLNILCQCLSFNVFNLYIWPTTTCKDSMGRKIYSSKSSQLLGKNTKLQEARCVNSSEGMTLQVLSKPGMISHVVTLHNAWQGTSCEINAHRSKCPSSKTQNLMSRCPALTCVASASETLQWMES